MYGVIDVGSCSNICEEGSEVYSKACAETAQASSAATTHSGPESILMLYCGDGLHQSFLDDKI